MKKIFKSKKWIAFFLALLLVVSTSITSSDAFLWATEEHVENETGAPADNETNEVVKKEVTVTETEQTPSTEDPNKQENQEDPDKQENQEDPNKQENQEDPDKQENQEDPNKQENQEDPDKQENQEDLNKQDQEDSDELIEEDQPIEGELEEEILDGVALFAAAPLGTHSVTLTAGQEMDISCDNSSGIVTHDWNSSNSDVVEIGLSGKNAHIKAKKEGDAG